LTPPQVEAKKHAVISHSTARLFSLGLFLMASVGCSSKDTVPVAPVVDAGPPHLTEQEPNNRPDQAQPLTGSAVVSASLAAERLDEDWYALKPSSPKSVDVTVSGLPGAEVSLEVYDPDHNRLLATKSPGMSMPVTLRNLRVTGSLNLRVAASTKGSGGAYTLTVLFSEPRPGQEAEPNDRAADATALHEGEVAPNAWQASGYITYPDDVDYYRVQLTEVPDGGPELDAGSPGEGIAAPPAPGGVPTLVLPTDGGAPGAASPGATAAPGGAIPPPGGAGQPSTQPTPPGQATAPGQPTPTPGGAGPSPSAQNPTAPDAGAGPEQPQPGREALRIELAAIPNVRPELQVLSAAEGVLFTATGKLGEPLSLRNVAVRTLDKMVYVVVKSAWEGTGKEAKRGFNVDTPYTLTITREAAGVNAELEPNDDPDHATPLPMDGYREGFISTKADVDYYVLKPQAPSIVNVQVSGVERVDLVLSVVKPAEDGRGGEVVLKRANDGALKEPEYLSNIACQSVCYFRVEGALKKVAGKWLRTYSNPDQPYRISVSATPDDGSREREPNDTTQEATPLTLGKPIRGNVQPVHDDDFFLVDLSDRPVKTPLKATVTGILKVDIGLYLWRLGDDGGKELVQSMDHARGDQPRVVHYSAAPGKYLVEVRDAKNRESNFQDSYQLVVEEAQ
jgi:hypothetical protein